MMLPSFAALSALLAEVVRSGGNPNHGSDGKFTSGESNKPSSGGGRTYTPAERWDLINEAYPAGVQIHEEGGTRIILNGPWKGRKLPFVPTNAELAGRNVSHSLMTEKRFMRDVAPGLMKRWMQRHGWSKGEARAHARAMIRGMHARVNPPPASPASGGATIPPRPPDTARLHVIANELRRIVHDARNLTLPTLN